MTSELEFYFQQVEKFKIRYSRKILL